MTKADDRATLLRIEREHLALRVDVREDGRWVRRCALCGAGEVEPHRAEAFCGRIEAAFRASSTLSDVGRVVAQTLARDPDDDL